MAPSPATFILSLSKLRGVSVLALSLIVSIFCHSVTAFIRPDENAFLYRFQPVEKFSVQQQQRSPAAWPLFYHRTFIPPKMLPPRMDLSEAAERLASTPTRSAEGEASTGFFGGVGSGGSGGSELGGGIDKRRAPLEMLLKDLWQQESQDIYEPMRFGLAGRK